MANLIDLTLTLGSDRISLVPGLVGVETMSAALSEQRDVLEEVIEAYLI